MTVRVQLARKMAESTDGIRDGHIVLYALFTGETVQSTDMPVEFVTWWQDNETGKTYNGHYCQSLPSALEEFERRWR